MQILQTKEGVWSVCPRSRKGYSVNWFLNRYLSINTGESGYRWPSYWKSIHETLNPIDIQQIQLQDTTSDETRPHYIPYCSQTTPFLFKNKKLNSLWNRASVCFWRWMLNCRYILQCLSLFKRKKKWNKCLKPSSLYVCILFKVPQRIKGIRSYSSKNQNTENCKVLLCKDSRGCFSWLPLILNTVFCTKLIKILWKAISKKAKAFKTAYKQYSFC